MAKRDYEIILSPDLAITPAEFASSWNDLTETHAIGPAHVEKVKGAQYDPTLVATIPTQKELIEADPQHF